MTYTKYEQARQEAELAKLVEERRKLAAEARLAELSATTAELRLSELNAATIRTGRFVYYGHVDDTGVNYIRREIETYVLNHPAELIEVTLCSPGGSLFAGLHFFEMLRAYVRAGTEVTTIASGYAASAAGVILQAGSKRIMRPDAYLLIHEASAGAIGKASEIKDEAILLEKLTKQMVEIYARRGNVTQQYILRKIDRKDWWIRADEALELGFIDEIG